MCYEGNGSKRWDGKTIFVDSKLLVESYEHTELVSGKEISILWKSKSKGAVYWKVVIIDSKGKCKQIQVKSHPVLVQRKI